MKMFVFRKFDKLGALNLLYQQSDLTLLQTRIRRLDAETAASLDPDVRDAARTWEELKRLSNQGDAKTMEQMRIATELKEKIKDYRKCHEAMEVEPH
jgi:hypothetical protein